MPCRWRQPPFDRLAVVAEGILRRAPANDFAHRAFSHLLQRFGRVFDVEEIGLGIDHGEEDRELDVQDVLVARQHETCRRRCRRRTDILLLHRHLDDLDGFHRPEVEMQPRRRNLFLRLAKAKLDTTLVRLDDVDALEKPEDDKNRGNNHCHAAVETAGYDVAELILAAPDDIFQIGRPAPAAARAVRPLPPRSLIITAAAAPWAAAAILIAPGHQNLVVR
ncbi:hypothetical protein AJ87_29160 [Rhizobium yanglingense]|nr:hypothetical protein AJ87_29160 [Rhizobium yanglingense]